VATENRSACSKSLIALSCVLALICLAAIAAPAQASSGIWNRAWGKGVNGGSAFGICTVAATCQAGSVGTLGGELNGATAVGTDTAGNVYVADSDNGRIQKFDASGNFQRLWGGAVNGGVGPGGICTVAASCLPGTTGGAAGGQFGDVEGVATDGAGNVYVADTTNNRIQKFDSSGNFLRAWGRGVDSSTVGTGFEICTVAASCQAGTTGGLGGEMSFPVGIATDAGGNVYVADVFNRRIQKFDSSGNFLRAWGMNVDSANPGVFGICTVAANCLQGTVGSLGGEFNSLDGLATDPAGNVYASDFSNKRIQKFDSTGNFLRAWGKSVNGGGGFGICTVAGSCQAGTAGTLGGELNAPDHLAADGAGNVYVADNNNNRIQKFGPSGNFQRAWGKSVNGGGVFGVCTVAASCHQGTTGALGGEFSDPIGVATDAAGELYVADLSQPRIQKFAADPVPPPPAGGGSTPPPGGGPPPPTGQRAAALKKCKKQHKKSHSKKKFKKCKKQANLLPV
jgi:sugar lactone lactonase YvrE